VVVDIVLPAVLSPGGGLDAVCSYGCPRIWLTGSGAGNGHRSLITNAAVRNGSSNAIVQTMVIPLLVQRSQGAVKAREGHTGCDARVSSGAAAVGQMFATHS
jgi:hypothetical protein